MKAEFDKEIDSLLRESARRTRVASSGRSAEPFAAAHLDADEQSAFAENALPAAARTHYTAHLADCNDCRRSVTQLMLAAGTAAQLNARETVAATGVQVEASTRIGWRERLAALLAPGVWRYAVPALALLLVGAVTFIVLTNKPERGTSIAQHNTTEAQKARATATQTEAHHAQQNDNLAPTQAPGESGTLASNSNATASNPNDSQQREEIAANADRTGTSQPVVVAPLNDSAAPPPPAPAMAGSGTAANAPPMPEMALPTPAPTPFASDGVAAVSEQEAKTKNDDSSAAPRKPEQRNSDFENRQYEERQQRERLSGPRRNNEQVLNRRAPDTNNASERADRRSGELASSTAAATPRPAAGRAQTRAEERDKDEKRAKEDSEPAAAGARAAKSVAETRSVAGRRFRRQGDAWVDTAYTAGQSYASVRRNSEQFRALTADEPQLRRIADALGGDITVVWKGRAYRIK